MGKSLAVVLRYEEENKYSLNALVGSLQCQVWWPEIEVITVTRKEPFRVRLEEALRHHGRALACVSFYSSQVWEVERFLERVRSPGQQGVIWVAGGPHASALPLATLRMGFDLVAVGEAEHSFPCLVQACLEGTSLEGLPGCASLDGQGALVMGPKPKPVSLDDFHGFALLETPHYGPLEITRGCPHGCRFCQTTHFAGGRMRHRSLGSVEKCVRMMVAAELQDIRVLTPNALAYGSPDGRRCDLGAVEALMQCVAKQLLPHNRFFFGSFPSEVRPEHVTAQSVALIRKYAHNDNLVIGAQSGSPRMLSLCHRGHEVEQVVEAVRHTVDAGLKPLVDFIFGLPEETQEDALMTLRLMEQLAGLGATLHAHTFMPLPGTPWAHVRPQPVSPAVREAMSRLIPKGVVFGQWERQEKLAEKFARWMAHHADEA